MSAEMIEAGVVALLNGQWRAYYAEALARSDVSHDGSVYTVTGCQIMDGRGGGGRCCKAKLIDVSAT